MKKIILLLFSLLFSLSICADSIYTVNSVPNVQILNSHQFVSNPDHIISGETVTRLDTMLYRLREKTTAEVAVVLLKSIGDIEIKPFATELFATWGIGKREKDNGLLILFVEDQRKITFETGYGVEGILPDILCHRIQQDYMLPYFKEGDYNTGFIEGVGQVVRVMTTPEAAEELMVTNKPVHQRQGNGLNTIIIYYLIASVLISLFFFVSIRGASKNAFSKESYSQYKALIGYKKTLLFCALIFPLFCALIYIRLSIKLRRLRNQKQICDQCGTTMKKLNEQDDDNYLTAQERTEEKINSIDYDVWLCEKCGNKKVYAYENEFTKYSRCPSCKAKAFALQSNRVLLAPTPISNGEGEKLYCCEHCKHTLRKRYFIPMIIVASGGQGGRGGGGSFGRGSFGGGSFGGGRSGGGGSTSGW